MSPWRWCGLGLLVVLVALVGAVGWRAYEVNAAYTAAAAQIDRLRSLGSGDPQSLSPANLSAAQSDLQDLHTQLARIDSATALPMGESLVRQLPWLGRRYAAARDLVRIGLLTADAGSALTSTGSDLIGSLGAGALGVSSAASGSSGGSGSGSGSGGASASGGPAHPTWLDALAPHQAELATAAQDIKSIQTLRGSLDDTLLPDRVRTRLAELDRLLDRPEVQMLTAVDLGAVTSALGDPAPARYLVAFQNPAELRPTGGFPGTMALVTLAHGQLQSYEFFDAHELSDAYVSHRQTRLPQPWPIQHFFPQAGFILHDALWWPDFPRSAQQLMAMYAETGWPPIDGVIAVQPEVASDLLRITGPFTVDFDGQRRTITADNVYAEIDRQRRTDIESHEDLLVHKEMLGLIGKTLIGKLQSADRGALLAGLRQFGAACQRRDLQVYAADPAVEAELDRQQCTGRLLPDPSQPTLAVTYANLVLAKNSMDMRPRLTLTAGPLDASGQRQMQLDIDLRDGAVADEDPVYAGFQRWWVSVHLPDGSRLLSEPGALVDPDAPNGGSYLAALFPDQTGRITVRFSMPAALSLLVRRQPGVSPGDVLLAEPRCPTPFQTTLTQDVLLPLASPCPTP